MNNKNKAPTWHLTEGYGASCDPFNWKLLKRFGKNWKPIGYFATPENMLLALYRKMCRTESVEPDLVSHIEAISRRVLGWAAALSEHLDLWGLEAQKAAGTSEGGVSDQAPARNRKAH